MAIAKMHPGLQKIEKVDDHTNSLDDFLEDDSESIAGVRGSPISKTECTLSGGELRFAIG
jgi:hypothetical protein